MSVNSTNPSQLFGGTWVALNEGRVLIGAGTSYPAGSTGGEATHTLTTNEMPSHSHSGKSDTDGSHSHTRGTMNINGSFIGNSWGLGITSVSGAFTGYESSQTGTSGSNFNRGKYGGAYFTASNDWTGSTSSSGSHWHYVYLDNTGDGSAHNNMQPYLSVYMWKRTA